MTSERRVRQIIREELVAAGLKRGPSVIARIRAARERELFSESAVRSLADKLLQFQRDGGLVVLK